MRGFLALCIFLVFPSVIYCQTTRNSAEAMVERIIASGGYSGIDDKQLGRMGDAAAVVVTKVLADRTLSLSEMEMVLAIIHLSFSAERLVEDATDRKPRTTLFVLQYLNSSTSDQKLKRRIEEEKHFVLEQFADAPTD